MRFSDIRLATVQALQVVVFVGATKRRIDVCDDATSIVQHASPRSRERNTMMRTSEKGDPDISL
jgi:hypothetical protein